MHARSHHITTIAIVIVAACTGDSSTAPSGDGSAGSVLVRPPATPVRLEVSPYKATTLRGMSIFPYLFQVMSDSTRIPVIARWTSTDKRVIDVDAGTGYAIAIGPGEASIRAEANDLVAAAAIAVQDPTPIDPGDALIVDSFSVIELQAQPAGSMCHRCERTQHRVGRCTSCSGRSSCPVSAARTRRVAVHG